MTYDEMITVLTTLNDDQDMRLYALPHCSNLLHQLNKRELGREDLYEQIVNLYILTRQVCFDLNDISGYITEVTSFVNCYMDFFWPPQNNPFSHQADFISSIIPEMLCILFGHIISSYGVNLEVSAQKDLAIECIFDILNGGTIRFKNKRVDVAVVKPCQLVFNETDNELPIPLMAIECKTNLDKNMISGIEHSVSELKKTFPDCCYFVVTEVSDFDVKKSNYASSGIDEMYILRQQKRGLIRRNPEQRKPINSMLVKDIAEIFIHNIVAMNADVVDLDDRMRNGKLIGRTL